MKRVLRVHLGKRPEPIGVLRYNVRGARQSAVFEYEPSWLSASERFALEPSLPLVYGPQFHKKVHRGSVFFSVIADTEPDGWGRRVILRDHAKSRKRRAHKGEQTSEPLNDLDFLLSVDDIARVGALRFADEKGVFRRVFEEGRRGIPPLVELRRLMAASHAIENQTETEDDLAYLRGLGTSLGGLRPKCTICDEDGHLAIGKFPSVTDERAVTKAEVLTMTLASRAGIRAAEARLVDSGGVPVVVVRRFDRRLDGTRVFYASAATMLGVSSKESERAYTDIVDAIRQHGSHVQEDIEELWRRIAFSVLVTNVDDHLHNHGFVHEQYGQWRLSPAFDINPISQSRS